MSFASEPAILSRDVVGTLIPAGTKVELPEGAQATITQALGGSYTVQVEGHLFRIEGKDADAIGKIADRVPDLAADASEAEVEQAVWTQLKTCYDPEIPINIVELGLIYECRLEPLGSREGSPGGIVRLEGNGADDIDRTRLRHGRSTGCGCSFQISAGARCARG